MTAWAALYGEPHQVDADEVAETVAEVTEHLRHLAAASILSAITVRRPFGRRSAHMALVAAHLSYRLAGRALPDLEDGGHYYDELVRRAGTGRASLTEIADALATVADGHTSS